MRISDWSSDVCSSDLVDFRLATARHFDRTDKFGKLFGAVIPDVVKPVRRRETTRLLAVVVFGRVIERQDDAVDDIVDEGEITKHVAVIIDVDRPALENRLGEFPDRHVGPPPRAINREEAKADRKSVAKGKSVSGRVDPGGRRTIKKKKK